MKCPVCPVENLSETAVSCPNCRTDLAPLQRIRQLAGVHLNDAIRLAGEGLIDQAVEKSYAALALDGGLLTARRLLGKLLWRKQLIHDALCQWQLVLKQAPQDEETMQLLASARIEVRRRAAWRFGAALVLVSVFTVTVWTVTRARQSAAPAAPVAAAVPVSVVSSPAPSAAPVPVPSAPEPLRIETPTAASQYQEAEKLAGEFAAYRASHSRFDSEFQTLTELRDRTQTGLASAEKSLKTERQKREDIAVQVTALRQQMDQQRKWEKEALLPLLVSLRPPNVDKVTTAVTRLRAECERLKADEKQHRERGIFIMDSLVASGIRSRLRRAEDELQTQEAEYERSIRPWEDAIWKVNGGKEVPLPHRFPSTNW